MKFLKSLLLICIALTFCISPLIGQISTSKNKEVKESKIAAKSEKKKQKEKCENAETTINEIEIKFDQLGTKPLWTESP
ncbi:MAG: hypothetical protein AAF573_14365 [Bacteroidota bacterium]